MSTPWTIREELREEIAALEAENAALVAERDRLRDERDQWKLIAKNRERDFNSLVAELRANNSVAGEAG